MTLFSRHRTRNSSPGGLRPSTLPLGHGGSPQYWLSHVDGEETFFVSFKPPSPGTEPQTLAWKAAVLTTTLGPPPSFEIKIEHTQETQDIETMLGQCWADVVDIGPTLTQHWFNVSCLLSSPGFGLPSVAILPWFYRKRREAIFTHSLTHSLTHSSPWNCSESSLQAWLAIYYMCVQAEQTGV